MGTMRRSIVWFRNDLRTTDHAALRRAAAQSAEVVCVYVFEADSAVRPGGASRWWLHHALDDLARALQALGARLILRCGHAHEVLPRLVEETDADGVFWNRRFEPHQVLADQAAEESLRRRAVEVVSCRGNLLFEPHEVQTGAGGPYRVFTPYWRACLTRQFPEPEPTVVSLPGAGDLPTAKLSELNLLPKVNWDAGFHEAWQPTQRGAREALERFRATVAGYPEDRDRPDREGTSRLSPYLHFGQLSPREVAVGFARDEAGSAKFLAELGWREFAHHLLFHYPHTASEPLRPEFSRFPWQEDASQLRAWQRGETGYPIVDAGMRQLWATGWMHNRVRMIAASFLVKHLLQPWQHGAAWFWDTLVDADLASNSLGWQWVAGCGADAAPYFRVFNPVTQGQRFDPEGAYVKRWVPELGRLPAKCVHQPSALSVHELSAFGVSLGDNYPHPVIGLKEGRERALRAYEQLKKART